MQSSCNGALCFFFSCSAGHFDPEMTPPPSPSTRGGLMRSWCIVVQCLSASWWYLHQSTHMMTPEQWDRNSRANQKNTMLRETFLIASMWIGHTRIGDWTQRPNASSCGERAAAPTCGWGLRLAKRLHGLPAKRRCCNHVCRRLLSNLKMQTDSQNTALGVSLWQSVQLICDRSARSGGAPLNWLPAGYIVGRVLEKKGKLLRAKVIAQLNCSPAGRMPQFMNFCFK